MASTMLEQTRATLEERERLERLVVKDFKNDAKGHKERLNQGHRVAAMLNQLQAQSERLITVFQDEDGIRREEIEALKGNDPYRSFYERLKEVRDYHRRHPNQEITEAEDDDAIIKAEPRIDFSGEETGGRFLDLHEHFHSLQNAKFKKEMPYSEYCVSFDDFEEILREHRLSKPYRDYLSSLLRYLESFYVRTQPLQSLERVYKDLADFSEEFEEGRVPGWEDRGEGKQVSEAEGAIDLEAFASVEELLTIGPEKLKEALAALGLKTGGTPQQRAERLWLSKSTPLEQIPKKHFAKTSAIGKSAIELAKNKATAKDIALDENKVSALRAALKEVPQETKDNVEKKAARTFEEIQAEAAEQELADVASDSDNEEDFIYNPLKLPLGYDGKPIPYWLYKLHGLNQEFNCEICGNHTYKGRREFERHFREWRHQNSMRAMGIPNNKNFFEITKIKDAQELWQNIQDRQKGGFKKEVEEEFEDDQGNVYNRRTYEDLKRQGLI